MHPYKILICDDVHSDRLLMFGLFVVVVVLFFYMHFLTNCLRCVVEQDSRVLVVKSGWKSPRFLVSGRQH